MDDLDDDDEEDGGIDDEHDQDDDGDDLNGDDCENEHDTANQQLSSVEVTNKRKQMFDNDTNVNNTDELNGTSKRKCLIETSQADI